MGDENGSTDYAASVRALKTTRWLGRPLHYHAEVTSTNDVLAAMARAGAQAGTMVISDYQRQGKGRLGRRWLAPPGTSLLFSLLFRPSWPAKRASWLTMLGGLAAVEAIKACTGLRPQLKWPNDLVLPGTNRWLKVGGMLLEGQLSDGRWGTSILGIGINANLQPDQIPDARMPATSLLKEMGGPIDRAQLLGALLARLEQGYETAAQGHSPRQAWQDLLVTIGQSVTVSQLGDRPPIVGTAISTDDWGRLIVRDRDGHEVTVAAGDVSLQVDNSRD